ncbi:MAG: helix-turn-helix transcriptional regulator [Mesorhizobium sp.]
MAKLNDEQFIDLIYATLAGEASWSELLDRLNATLPGGKSILFYHDASLQTGAWQLSSGLDEAALARYSTHYSKINPWMPKASVRKVGLGVIADEMLPTEDLTRTEFYNDFLLQQNCHSAVGITILREAGRSFLLSTLTSQSDPEANMEAANRLTVLAPHLQRAFRYHRSSSRQAGGIGVLMADALHAGMIMIDETRSIRSASIEAQRQLARGTCVGTTGLGKLKVLSEEGDQLLGHMLNRSFTGDDSVSLRVNGTPLTFIRVGKDKVSAFFEGPTVIILWGEIRDRSPTQEGLASALCERFGLTPAEVRLAVKLHQGLSLRQASEKEKISYENARTRLKAIFYKTGASRQVELAQLLERLIPRT